MFSSQKGRLKTHPLIDEVSMPFIAIIPLLNRGWEMGNALIESNWTLPN